MTRTPVCAVIAMLLFVPGMASAQSGNTSDEAMRTPDGQPDISGIFTFRTLTPLERPQALAGQETLDAESAAQFRADSLESGPL